MSAKDDWKKPINDTESYPGTLRGYREFYLAASTEKNDSGTMPKEYELSSVNLNRRYEPDSEGWMHATCDSYAISTKAYSDLESSTPKHASPKDDCSCGFYVSYAPGATFYSNRDTYTYAVVETAGKLILSSKGFRAEKMRIVAYWCPKTKAEYYKDTPACEYLAKAKEYTNRTEMLLDFPQEDLSELIGKENFLKCVQDATIKEGQFLKDVLRVGESENSNSLTLSKYSAGANTWATSNSNNQSYGNLYRKSNGQPVVQITQSYGGKIEYCVQDKITGRIEVVPESDLTSDPYYYARYGNTYTYSGSGSTASAFQAVVPGCPCPQCAWQSKYSNTVSDFKIDSVASASTPDPWKDAVRTSQFTYVFYRKSDGAKVVIAQSSTGYHSWALYGTLQLISQEEVVVKQYDSRPMSSGQLPYEVDLSAWPTKAITFY